ncbi:metallophosphoesterase family protein [Deinococcus hopiensis]|uniref:3',5'-cyclic AMP phosphodiesterase CpdA n=1 Tax=Deinococcus hopiensis KR-140 TaxID=695939 RepID=A0A1W1VRZ1_9DEIO|nr:metallophosphoesterase [Deinococcus hopiensis]SMB96118.1 3',5'-cyclic AMP phosphodiesterase CpdA [Deinococcus hopiensis KR-140]
MRALLPLLLPPLLLGAAPTTDETLRVAVLSDFNGSYGNTTYPAALSHSVGQIVEDWKPDAVLSAGDLIAGQKARLTDAQVQAMWAAFDREVHAPLRRAGLPFGFTLGNHDASLARDRREAAAYWRAHPPALTFLDRSAFPFRFSFLLRASGRSLFVASLDASSPDLSADQRGWLAAQLAAPQAKAAGARIVLGHLPLAGISREKNRPGEVIRGAVPLREVMERGRVLAYISGHQAAYYPGRLGRLNVFASGGIGGRDYVGYPGTARSTLSLLTFDLRAGTATFRTVDAETGAEVATASLPARIHGLGGPVTRVEALR